MIGAMGIWHGWMALSASALGPSFRSRGVLGRGRYSGVDERWRDWQGERWIGRSSLRFLEQKSAAPLLSLFCSHVEGALEAFRMEESDQVDKLLAHGSEEWQNKSA
jgi:hypothetical protein